MPIVKSNIAKSKFSLGKLNEKISFNTFSVKHGKTSTIKKELETIKGFLQK